MGKKENRIYLHAIVRRYRRTSRTAKGAILLLTISAASIDRVLRPARVRLHKSRCTTRQGTLLRNQIPIRTQHWEIMQPGFVEADTVAHCGNSIAGEFVWSLTFTDILTSWTENRATWGKGSTGVLDRIKDIEQHIPFTLKGFNCDNGSEFLNYHLLRYFTDRPKVTAVPLICNHSSRLN